MNYVTLCYVTDVFMYRPLSLRYIFIESVQNSRNENRLCISIYICLICISKTVSLYFPDTLATYQTARCNNTHNHNMYYYKCF
jgi:hypothetical protein